MVQESGKRVYEVLQKLGPKEQATVLIQTRARSVDEEEARAALEMLQSERLATRRSELLRHVQTRRYGKGAEFHKNYKESRLEAQQNIVRVAPKGKATNLWLADAVAVQATKEELEDLAQHEDVRNVIANPTFKVPEVLRTPLEDVLSNVDGSTWGLAQIRAPEVWSGLGRGHGVLVGHLDTGVDDTHPALAGKVQCFFDVDDMGNCTPVAPHDTDIHGTHTAGTIVGRSFNGVNIGVAPEARLCSAVVLPGGSGSFSQILGGMQCLMDSGVHVMNLSLGANGYSTIWNTPILNITLSGISVVASIGNAGAGTSGGPGNDFFAMGVGATGLGFTRVYKEESFNDAVAGFSSGQTLVDVPYELPFGTFFLTYIKPDISAPGVQVLSSIPGGDIAALNGTSMAAPHVSGSIALVLSAMPDLIGTPGVAFILRDIFLGAGREDLGEAGRDSRYGYGRLDVLAAAEAAVSLLS